MAAPTIFDALVAGWRATARSAWLAPVGMVVGLARGMLVLPAAGFALWLAARGAVGGILGRGPSPRAALGGALDLATEPRPLSILAGLWLAALLLGAALRVAYLAGALPTLGRELANGAARSPEFAAGVAWRFPRVAGTAIFALLLDLTGSGFALTVATGALLVTLNASKLVLPVGAAALVAAALALALFVPPALSAVGDAALLRSALRDESPARSVAKAFLRFARRPAAFLLVALVVGLFGLLASGSLRAIANLAIGLAQGSNVLLLLGPQLMVTALTALVAALVELWRFATLALLACGE